MRAVDKMSSGPATDVIGSRQLPCPATRMWYRANFVQHAPLPGLHID